MFEDIRSFVQQTIQPGGWRFFLQPKEYVNPAAFQGFDLERWSENQYEWVADGRWVDVLQDPGETVETGRGDCEDYAAVATATLLARGQPCIVSVHFSVTRGHVTVWSDGTLYSSGVIREDYSLEEYAEDNNYRWAFHNRVEPRDG